MGIKKNLRIKICSSPPFPLIAMPLAAYIFKVRRRATDAVRIALGSSIYKTVAETGKTINTIYKRSSRNSIYLRIWYNHCCTIMNEHAISIGYSIAGVCHRRLRYCALRYILKRFILSSLIKPLLRKAYILYTYTADSKAARVNEIFYVY